MLHGYSGSIAGQQLTAVPLTVSGIMVFTTEAYMTGNTTLQLRKLALVSLVAVSAGLGGCATTSNLDELRSQVDAVSAEASAAKAEASSAKAEAAEAKAMAAQAIDTANEAKATSQETETKIDRMFKKAMYK
jgi:murein lipoprotein